MSVTARVQTVGTAATLIESGTGDGKTVLLRSASANMFLGPSDVTTATGFQITALTDILSMVLYPGDDLYAICGSAAQTVMVMALRDNQ